MWLCRRSYFEDWAAKRGQGGGGAGGSGEQSAMLSQLMSAMMQQRQQSAPQDDDDGRRVKVILISHLSCSGLLSKSLLLTQLQALPACDFPDRAGARPQYPEECPR